MSVTRRDALVLTAAASAAGFAGIAPAQAAEGDMYDVDKLMQPNGMPDRPQGSADAKVTLIEYASPTCPHCASFHVNVYPALKEQYIDTGKVRFILRPFVRHVLDAVIFMLADTIEGEGYHTLIDTYFATQTQWAQSSNPRDAILAIAKQHGFTEESFEAALTNQELFAGMEQMREQVLNEFDLTGTPSFYINGKMLSGDKSIEELAAEIDPLLS